MTDALVYSIVIPVLPFQLERLGYDHVSGLTGWLLFAYVRHCCYDQHSDTTHLSNHWQSAGLVVCSYSHSSLRMY